MNTRSAKLFRVRDLPGSNDKDLVVRVIEVLENFTDDERRSIFDSSSIIQILKLYTVKELKEKVEKAYNKPDIKVGDIITFGIHNDYKGVVLDVAGEKRDRVTIICREDYHIRTMEGVSVYDLKKVGHTEVSELLTSI